MPLEDKAILKAKPAGKARKLFDGGGLYIEVAPGGGKLWRLKYRFDGREKRLALGAYPDTSLKVARKKRDEARAMLASGVDPGERRRVEKAAEREGLQNRQSSTTRDLHSPGKLRIAAAGQRPLEALGIDELEESAYRTLLTHGIATAKEIANALVLTPRKSQQLLDGIASKGLASHSPERPRRYIPVPPELAIEALVGQRQVVLERARSAIPELKKQAANSASARDPEQPVEVITSYAALGQILAQLRQTVQEEVIGFQRAPWLYRKDASRPEVRLGVRTRSISDAGYIALPGALATLQSEVKRGEEARVFPVLPIKMIVVDRRIALIPLNVEDQGGPTLLVRAPSLLNALYELFEMTWARATPIAFTRTGAMATGKPDTQVSEVAAQMIPLLAAGLNDKAIVYETGISIATLNRRIAELMRRFDTRTRFQLGWRAALDAFPERLAAPARRRP
ncbi:integrase arm-type DNA-binding domain-containing protein [Rhodanobacter sp. MP7CTX1]|uniref:integrase arm-type DNA-binding domain-containing protein n=1 Tax=Rhodanobacter sp. MP7CTX1 TaxID=2723084 RepID=UPI00161F8AD0|nr:integrase arm-type DNA-binding domain-containing protein [Rhodanobacter sp. MP7CTX1]MBB6188442.1 sugar-specific transcriptional regulator TrmB [Rhodanobacter sp. MP7CTX1]